MEVTVTVPHALTGCAAVDNHTVEPCSEVVARLVAIGVAGREGLDATPLQRRTERIAHVHLDELAGRR
jgi:hypothetical protein